jgi:hypothetical protein
VPIGDVSNARGVAVSRLRLQDRLLRVVTLPIDPWASSWIAAVIERHARPFSRHEFLRAIRALSVRYVERRSELGARDPLDSAGKRAAFAGFYAPLHFLTVRSIAASLDIAGAAFSEVIDLGCGTGVAGAAIAGRGKPGQLTGVDRHSWSLDEARWNWDYLGVRGKCLRANMVETARRLAGDRPRRRGPALTVLAWSVNELPAPARTELLSALIQSRRQGRAVLVVEPISRRAVPWWSEWVDESRGGGRRVDEWAFPSMLPEPLQELDEAAGFDHHLLTARSLYAPAL